MTLPVPGHPASELWYACRADVVAACAEVDVLAVVEAALRQHAAGHTLLPDEAYLGWRAPEGGNARSLAMPGGLQTTADGWALGVKVINGCLTNPDRGLARAQGLTLLFDPQTGWPRAVLEAAHISALRTAAVSAITARRLGRPGCARLAVLGCGALARAHLDLLTAALPGLTRVALYDTSGARRGRLARDLAAQWPGRLEVTESASARDCVRGAEIVVTTTTVTSGYIGPGWLAPGALVAHVSLDDLLPEVIQRADLLVVDDWNLVSQDSRRLLGALYRAGELRSPAGDYHPDSTPRPDARAVDTTLGDILLGSHPGRAGLDDIVISNPFGMAILDIAIAHAVLPVLIRNGARGLPR